MLPVPGVGQVGQGLQNTWGLEEDVDEEEEDDDDSVEEGEEKVTKMEEEEQDSRGGNLGFIYSHTSNGFFLISRNYLMTLSTLNRILFCLKGEVVEISDSEEEEVIILNPETPNRRPKYVQHSIF